MHWRCPQTQEAFLEGRKERRKGRREGDKGTVWAPEGEVASGQAVHPADVTSQGGPFCCSRNPRLTTQMPAWSYLPLRADAKLPALWPQLLSCQPGK